MEASSTRQYRITGMKLTLLPKEKKKKARQINKVIVFRHLIKGNLRLEFPKKENSQAEADNLCTLAQFSICFCREYEPKRNTMIPLT